MKQKFLDLLNQVNRPGVDQLADWLTNKSDFFQAPASRMYHGAVEGGLVEHSITVYEQFKNIPFDIPFETTVVCSLLHDVCKANFYKIELRNRKNEAGQWEKYPCYAIEDQIPYGHGEKSVFIISQFIHLSIDEAMAIRWHMGAWSAESYTERQTLSSAMEKYPLILALQIADQTATFWDKK
jgi:hypothetical protein